MGLLRRRLSSHTLCTFVAEIAQSDSCLLIELHKPLAAC